MYVDDIIYYNLDIEKSIIYIGKNNGFSILQFNPFSIQKTIILDGGIKRVIPTDNIYHFFIVGGGKKPFKPMNQLHLFDVHHNKILYTLSFSSIISDISYSCSYIVITCKSNIYIYNINNYSLYKKIPIHHSLKVISYPKSNICNTLFIQNKLVCMLNTNSMILEYKIEDEISFYTIDSTRTFLITADKYGKYITLYNINPFQKKITYQRGNKPSSIYSIQLTHDHKYMVCISSTNTLHLFRIKQRYTYIWMFEKSIDSVHIPNKGFSHILFMGKTYSFICIDLFGNCNYVCIDNNSLKIERYISTIQDKNSPFIT